MDALIDWIRLLSPCLLTAALGWIAAASKTRSDEHKWLKARTDANNDLTMCIARIFLVEFYDRFIVSEERMSIERWEEIEKLHKAYKALGGNGTGDRLYEELKQKRPYVVNQTTTENRRKSHG